MENDITEGWGMREGEREGERERARKREREEGRERERQGGRKRARESSSVVAIGYLTKRKETQSAGG